MPTTYAIPNGRTVFDATTYTGTTAYPQTITNTTGFKPDFVWAKSRSNAQYNGLFDSNRSGYALYSNTTDPQDTTEQVTFNSNGFSTPNKAVDFINTNSYTYVAWQWQAGQGTTSTNTNGAVTSTVSVNAAAGFSIVSYTGTLTAAGNATIGHGLGVAPSIIISKRITGGTSEWVVQTPFLGQNKFLILNTTGAVQDMVSVGAGTLSLPTTTTFGSTYYTGLNVNTQPCVAYCWAPVAGFSQFGTYTGNGSADGPFIYTGFRPAYVIVKQTNTTEYWYITDNKTSPYNQVNQNLVANLAVAEGTGTFYDFLSNGFKLRSTQTYNNQSGGTYMYMAFAENPFKYANAR